MIANGVCVYDIFHKDGVVGDVASFRQIKNAAADLYGTCLTGRTRGGWVRDLGKTPEVQKH